MHIIALDLFPLAARVIASHGGLAWCGPAFPAP